MKLVMQTKFGYPDGNCLAACLASIFEIDIEDIPDFGYDKHWWKRFRDWMLERFKLNIVNLRVSPDLNTDWVLLPEGYYIANGKSPRGLMHSVVCKDEDFAHDPHPEGGWVKVESFTFFVKVM